MLFLLVGVATNALPTTDQLILGIFCILIFLGISLRLNPFMMEKSGISLGGLETGGLITVLITMLCGLGFNSNSEFVAASRFSLSRALTSRAVHAHASHLSPIRPPLFALPATRREAGPATSSKSSTSSVPAVILTSASPSNHRRTAGSCS